MDADQQPPVLTYGTAGPEPQGVLEWGARTLLTFIEVVAVTVVALVILVLGLFLLS